MLMVNPRRIQERKPFQPLIPEALSLSILPELQTTAEAAVTRTVQVSRVTAQLASSADAKSCAKFSGHVSTKGKE